MSYNEKLADHCRELISLTHNNVEEKKMFGGLCFMVNEKMCVGVEKERLMVRLDPARFDEAMKKEGSYSRSTFPDGRQPAHHLEPPGGARRGHCHLSLLPPGPACSTCCGGWHQLHRRRSVPRRIRSDGGGMAHQAS